jgi:hypothetical protein
MRGFAIDLRPLDPPDVAFVAVAAVDEPQQDPCG